MPNDPKLSTKYEDVDESFDGPENSKTEATRRSSRSTRNQNPMNESKSQLSVHDSETHDHDLVPCDISHLFENSLNSVNSSNEETNLISPSISDKSTDNSVQDPSQSMAPQPTMTATELNTLIDQRNRSIP